MLGKCEGIVIRTVDYGETAKIVTIFTKEMGKIALMARGAKKPNSKLAGISQLFHYGQYLFYAGSGMGTMQQGETIDSFRFIREDIYFTAYVTYMAELIDRATEEKQPNRPLFNIFMQTLDYMREGYDAEILLNIFETKILYLLGIAPELNRCVNCGAKEGKFSFSLTEGGLLCDRCAEVDRYRIPISINAAKLLRVFQQINLEQLGNIAVSKETKKEIRHLLDLYYEQNAGLQLKSKKFLKQLENMQVIVKPRQTT